MVKRQKIHPCQWKSSLLMPLRPATASGQSHNVSFPFSWTWIYQEFLEGISSNLVPIFTLTDGWTDWNLLVQGQKSRSWWLHKAHALLCEADISGTLWRNPFTFGTNIHLNSRINWFDFGSQRSKVMEAPRSMYMFFYEQDRGNVFKLSKIWLYFVGQRSKSHWPPSRMWCLTYLR